MLYEVITVGVWYHIGATFNNTTKAWKLRVWDDTAGSVVHNASGTATNNISITDAPFAPSKIVFIVSLRPVKSIDWLLIMTESGQLFTARLPSATKPL